MMVFTVVGRIEGRSEQADFLDRASDSRGSNEVPNLERLQDHQEHPAGKI